MEKCYDEKADDVNIDALKSLLRQMDKPWIDSIWDAAISQYNATYAGKNVKRGNRKSLISYVFKNLASLRQFRTLSWEDGIEYNARCKNPRAIEDGVEGGYTKKVSESAPEPKPEKEVKWSRADKQNMSFVINTVGYDPFEDCNMSDNDRKNAFNILAGYCDSDGIKEDSHKLQSVIQLAQIQIQCRKMDELINAELSSSSPNEDAITKLSTTKKNLLATATALAKDNNISSNYSKNSSKGANTLSYKMKELADNDFEAIKVNLFDIKTSEAMKQIADLSNKSILEQLDFDSNDYVEIIKDQREMIIALTTERDALAEELRLLKAAAVK